MEINKNLQNFLFLDIETVCCTPTYEQLGERMQYQWQRKASVINPSLSCSELYKDKAAIYAEFGKVVTIAAGVFFYSTEKQLSLKIKSFHGDNEKDLLTEFREVLKKFPQDKLILCAHNGKEFDFPYLCRRMLVNSIAIPEVLNISAKKPWEVKHFDTLDYWKFGDRKNYTSLDLLAALFDIPGSKDDIDGSMVSAVYHQERNLERIAKYCCKDVVVTAQLFLKLNQLPIISEERIIFS